MPVLPQWLGAHIATLHQRPGRLGSDVGGGCSVLLHFFWGKGIA